MLKGQYTQFIQAYALVCNLQARLMLSSYNRHRAVKGSRI